MTCRLLACGERSQVDLDRSPCVGLLICGVVGDRVRVPVLLDRLATSQLNSPTMPNRRLAHRAERCLGGSALPRAAAVLGVVALVCCGLPSHHLPRLGISGASIAVAFMSHVSVFLYSFLQWEDVA